MKEKLEKWLDSLIKSLRDLENLGDFKINKDEKIGQFENNHIIFIEGNMFEPAVQITDAKLAGEILDLPVSTFARKDREYPIGYYFKYKKWIIYSISK